MNMGKKISAALLAGGLGIGLMAAGAAPAEAWTPIHNENWNSSFSNALTTYAGNTVTYTLNFDDLGSGKESIDLSVDPTFTNETVVSAPYGWEQFGHLSPGSTGGFTKMAYPVYGVGHGTFVVTFTTTTPTAHAAITARSGLYVTSAEVEVVSPALGIVSGPLPQGRFAEPYQFALQTTGFRLPSDTFTATGLNGTGLSLDPDSGIVSGTPSRLGTFPVTVTAHNGKAPDATASYSLTVIGVAPVLGDTLTRSATVGSPYASSVVATGTPSVFSITAGRLPNGLSLNKNTGLISGRPTVQGDYTFTVTAINSGGTGSAALEIVVGSASSDA
ncbi:putative Ig domain-containing protein [Subtercola boreus]|nr:putative Ig domain-containing protein [Subtercola boreus]